ncbi:MAG: hypothetical protein ABI443_10715 [Chthoniobacterales bacterium]
MPKTSKKGKYPYTLKKGSSIVKIYQEKKPSGIYFRVVYHIAGKRHRSNFTSAEDAHTEAIAKVAQLGRGDIDALQLNGKDRLTYGRALDAVREFDVPLDSAAAEYAQARKVLDGNSLIEAARFYMRHHGKGLTPKMVSEAVKEFKQAKLTAGRSPLYLKDIEYRLKAFAEAFACEVDGYWWLAFDWRNYRISPLQSFLALLHWFRRFRQLPKLTRHFVARSKIERAALFVRVVEYI